MAFLATSFTNILPTFMYFIWSLHFSKHFMIKTKGKKYLVNHEWCYMKKCANCNKCLAISFVLSSIFRIFYNNVFNSNINCKSIHLIMKFSKMVHCLIKFECYMSSTPWKTIFTMCDETWPCCQPARGYTETCWHVTIVR